MVQPPHETRNSGKPKQPRHAKTPQRAEAQQMEPPRQHTKNTDAEGGENAGLEEECGAIPGGETLEQLGEVVRRTVHLIIR